MTEQVVAVSVVLANLAIVVGVIVGAQQLVLQRRVFRADHERRKKQATIEFADQILERQREVRLRINDAFGKDTINPTDSRYEEDPELKNAVTRYLGLMERLSVGVNLGVYDLQTFARISGASTIVFFRRLWPVIVHRRHELRRDSLYRDFEAMVENLERNQKRYRYEPEDTARISES